MNDLALAVLAVEVVKKKMRDSLVSESRVNEDFNKSSKSFWNLF